MKIKDALLRAGHYFLSRLNEPSTYRGLVLMIGAGSWAKLDGSNKGELIMQVCLFVAGAIQAAFSQSSLYKPSEPK